MLHTIDETTFFFAALISLSIGLSSRKELENGILQIWSSSNFLILTDDVEGGNNGNGKWALENRPSCKWTMTWELLDDLIIVLFLPI